MLAQAARFAPSRFACVIAAHMPLSLKPARRIHPFVLQVQLAVVHADELADGVGLLQQRLAFAHRDDVFLRDKRQQFVETPDSRKSYRIGPLAPPSLQSR